MPTFSRIILIFLVVLAGCLGLISDAKAVCPSGPDLNVPVGTTSTIDNVGPCSYTNITINGTVTTPVGKKLELIATETFTISASGKINVSGKGDNAAGKGSDGKSSGTQCSGVWGTGGGGGGYGAAGGKGGDDVWVGPAGGATYGNPKNPTDLGSPGGDGGADATGGGFGALGGGAVIIKAKKFVLDGFIYANSANGGVGGPTGDKKCGGNSSSDGTGGGGGGSGGTVNIQIEEDFIFNGKIQANGGNGGDDLNCSGVDGTGGGGGGGRIYLFYKTKSGSGTISANGGDGGGGPCVAGAGSSGGGTLGTIVYADCSYLSCEHPNTIFPCSCGTATAYATSPWCCAVANTAYSGLADCCSVVACADKDGDGVLSIGCGGEDYDDDDPDVPLVDADKDGYISMVCPCDPDSLPPGKLGCYDCDDNNPAIIHQCFYGGLVPCGRKVDDPNTSLREDAPCTLCHFFVLAKRTIDFLFKSLILPLTLLMIIVAGAKFVGAGGSPEKINEAKTILFAAIIGFLIAFSAWLIINSALSFIAQGKPPALPEVAKILGQAWDKIECPVP